MFKGLPQYFLFMAILTDLNPLQAAKVDLEVKMVCREDLRGIGGDQQEIYLAKRPDGSYFLVAREIPNPPYRLTSYFLAHNLQCDLKGKSLELTCQSGRSEAFTNLAETIDHRPTLEIRVKSPETIRIVGPQFQNSYLTFSFLRENCRAL